jgi:zinc D-Ala-D-Ala carboxypeptidase
MNLTPHFTVAEALTGSGVTTLPATVIPNVLRLAQILEQMRQLLGDKPIVPTSWYRPAEKNAAVGGVITSGHPSGFAVDFKVQGMTPAEVVKALAPHVRTLGIDQLIEYDTHVHVSADPRARAQLLIAQRVGSDTTYAPWTPTASASRSPLMATLAPVTEPGAPAKKGSVLWWLGVAAVVIEVARHIFSKGQ